MDVLQSIVAGYNWRDHSSIGMPPAKVTDKDVLKIWKMLQERHEKIRTAAPKFSEGNTLTYINRKLNLPKALKKILARRYFRSARSYLEHRAPFMSSRT
jgi:hypothetical protein